MFEIIGFIALLAVTGYITAVGVIGQIMQGAFVGGKCWVSIAVAILGIALFILVCYNAPFTVVIQ